MNSRINVGVGKRKQAVARVFLKPGSNKVIINKIPSGKYLQYNQNYMSTIMAPFFLVDHVQVDYRFDIIILVKGGGLSGQAEAIQLGFARLLCKMDNRNRQKLKSLGFLTRDSRIKERKKYGLRKARKAPQYSKR